MYEFIIFSDEGTPKPGQVQELMGSFNSAAARYLFFVLFAYNFILNYLMYLLFFIACKPNFIVFCISSDISQQDQQILDEIKKATLSLNKNSMEQTAYFRALGAANNLKMDKFRDQVQKEIDDEMPKNEKGNIFLFWNILQHYISFEFIIYCIEMIWLLIPDDAQSNVSGEPVKEVIEVQEEHSFEGDGLPNMGNDSLEIYHHHDDPICDNDAATITISDSTEDELVFDDMPFYAN